MEIDIAQMPMGARVWIYQASQNLGEKEQKEIRNKISNFLQGWDSHGQPLKASYNLLYDRFILIAVDESFSFPSGCSIDKSVRFLKDLEEQLGIGFLEKSSVATLSDDNQIATFGLNEIKRKIQEGGVKPDTLIFNNLVNTLADFNQNWKIPASKSWLSRYFSNY